MIFSKGEVSANQGFDLYLSQKVIEERYLPYAQRTSRPQTIGYFTMSEHRGSFEEDALNPKKGWFKRNLFCPFLFIIFASLFYVGLD